MRLTDKWRSNWADAARYLVASTGNPQTPNTLPSGFAPAPAKQTAKHKYPVGQKVSIAHDDMTEEYEILEHTGVNLWDIPEYMLKDPSGHIIYQMETELTLPMPKQAAKWQPACECGADTLHGKNSAAMYHSDWCPGFRR